MTNKSSINSLKSLLETEDFKNNDFQANGIDKFNEFIERWKDDFILRTRAHSTSRKTNFTYFDALEVSDEVRTSLDCLFIGYIEYLDTNPLFENDFFKYLNSYKKGIKLNDQYFRHDLNVLHKYYKKIDKNEVYNPFSYYKWKRYVLFMLFKFSGLYIADLDNFFGVRIKGNREYNPLTDISRILRATLPSNLRLVEYDIYRANPTFINLELGIDRNVDVYSLMEKQKLNSLLNTHHEIPRVTIQSVRDQLKIIYGEMVNKVITEERFNNKGRLFEELTKYEAEYIRKFVFENGLKKYVRLHDAIILLEDESVICTEFGQVKFIKKEVKPLEIINEKKLFYYFDIDGKLITSESMYKDFFTQENFIRITKVGNDETIILKNTNKVVTPFNQKTNTVAFLSGHINESDEKIKRIIENRIAKDNRAIIPGAFLLIKPMELRYHRDSTTTFGLPFKNGFFVYTKGDSEIKCLKYVDVSVFFPPHKTQKMDFQFKKECVPMSVFERFLNMAVLKKDPLKDVLSEIEIETISMFYRMIGYLCHGYKDPSFCPAIIFSDEGANDENRKGGRGKTLIIKAIQWAVNTVIKGGNEFDVNYRHRFADINEFDKVYVIDDVPASFDYDKLYTNISGEIYCELKGKVGNILPFDQTPKFVITTNWAVRKSKEAVSTNRRFLEYKLSDFFNETNTPKSIFGHNFFIDWDAEEWNKFYNFIFACVGLFMEKGLEAPKYDKNYDNYMALFNSDAKLQEFERIFKIVSVFENGFAAHDFLQLYNDPTNNLRHEKYFNHINLKNIVNTYISYNNQNIVYMTGGRRWIMKTD